MHTIEKFTVAAVVAVTSGLLTVAASAQSQPSGTTASQPSSGSSQSAQQTASAGNTDQQAARQHLTEARQALEEMTKLPAATQLQGEQRTMITEFISNFNAFATATTDWRGKYVALDESLSKILETAGPATGTADPIADRSGGVATTGCGAGGSAASAGAAETAGAAGGFDPAIVAKLREVRSHLDAFEEASGDPIFIVDKLEDAFNDAVAGGVGGAASAGAGNTAVGTSGTVATGGAGGTVTIERAKLDEIRRQIDRLRQSLEK